MVKCSDEYVMDKVSGVILDEASEDYRELGEQSDLLFKELIKNLSGQDLKNFQNYEAIRCYMQTAAVEVFYKEGFSDAVKLMTSVVSSSKRGGIKC